MSEAPIVVLIETPPDYEVEEVIVEAQPADVGSANPTGGSSADHT